jgi:hypothetical protein
MSSLSAEQASAFARLALSHVRREWPNKLDHVLSGPEDLLSPKDLHPIFFGSFDWHSCVHGYWTLATCLRLHPDIPEARGVEALFEEALTPEHVAAEVAYLTRPAARGFERPYGWAWLLKLQAELLAHDGPWSDRLQPLADAFAARWRAYLPLAAYPVRTGVHNQTAFALALSADYARAARDEALLALLADKAVAWHHADHDAQAWEPSGDDFLSPTLCEAVCLQRLMPQGEFRAWLAGFLPHLSERRPASLFVPAGVTDRTDGKIAHLDGLNLSRAWCWRELGRDLEGPAAGAAREAADAHLAASLPHVEGDYMGEHWLASFAVLALTVR